jgi:hypothetical protein
MSGSGLKADIAYSQIFSAFATWRGAQAENQMPNPLGGSVLLARRGLFIRNKTPSTDFSEEG